MIAESDFESASQFVRAITEIPESTIWHNLRILRKKGLIEFGDMKEFKITEIGELTCSSSTAERSAVNREVVGANPACGTAKIKN